MTKKIYALGLIVLLSAICLTSIASAQTSWWRTYGGSSDDVGYSVRQTTDGGYIVAGYTFLFGVDGDFYLLKTNASGDTLWTRTYGGSSTDFCYSVEQTADGGYIIAGLTGSFGVGTLDVYLIKTNVSGDTLWTRTYGGYYADEGCSVRQTTDGGYIVVGGTSSSGAGMYDVYLIKTNASGDTLWTRTCGGSHFDEGDFVQQTTDGGYIITGFTQSFGAETGGVYFIKTNATGDTVWTRTFGAHGDRGYAGQQTTDGGYIIAGSTSLGAGSGDVYLVKTTASGETLWTRTYGGASAECGNSAQQTSDGSYIIGGYTASFGAGSNDVYLIKTDADGYVGIEEPLTRHPARPSRFLVQPNPFTSFTRVPGHETDIFALSDVTGRQVAVCKGDRIGEGLRPGVYFLSPVGPRAGNAATATIVKTAF